MYQSHVGLLSLVANLHFRLRFGVVHNTCISSKHWNHFSVLRVTEVFLVVCLCVASYYYCGSSPTLSSNNPATLKWYKWYTQIRNATLDIRKVGNPWSGTGCFSIGGTLPESGPVPATSTHTISSVDYDSLYVARLYWMDSEGKEYYNRNRDCYFTIQPSEWL